MKTIRKKAFSLIELSLVLLIIGIIITGATQSTRLISAFRISIAQSVTKSSPVTSIKGLIAWWESTSEESFLEEESEDGLKVSIWKDLNAQSSYKYNPQQTTEAYRPTYVKNAINGLPALRFDGSSQYLLIDHDAAFNPEVFTIFAVVNTVECGYYCAITNSRYSGPPSQGFTLYTSPTSYEFWIGDGGFWAGAYAGLTSFSPRKTDLLTAVYDGTTRSLYYKGTRTDYGSTVFVPNTYTTPLRIGAGSEEYAGFFYNGFIGELIFFNRALKAEERTAVEAYLIKKWGISF